MKRLLGMSYKTAADKKSLPQNLQKACAYSIYCYSLSTPRSISSEVNETTAEIISESA